MTSLINAVNNSNISNYLGEATVTLLIGMGYYLMKRATKDESKKEKKLITEDILDLKSAHFMIKDNTTKTPIEILSYLIQNKLTPTIDTYNLLIFNSYKNGFYNDSEKLKEEIFDSTSPISPEVNTYNMILKGLQIKYNGAQNLFEFDNEALKLKNWFITRGIKLTTESENIMMDILIDQNRFEKALNYFEDTHKHLEFDIYTYTTALRVIKKILKEYHYNNKTKDLNSFKNKNKSKFEKDYYNIYLEKISYVISAVEKVIKEKNCLLKDLGTIVDTEAYISAIIDAYIALKENEKAKQVFKDLSPIEESSFISLIKLYTVEKNLNQCLEVFLSYKKLLNQKDKMPSISVYGAILNSCAKLGNMVLAEELLTEMFKYQIYPNSHVYSNIINGYRLSGRLDCAIESYKLAEIDKENLTIAVVNTILNCCAEYSDFKTLIEIYERAVKVHQITPDKITFSILIKCYSKNKEFDKLWDLYRFLLENKIYDEITFNSLLDVFANAEHEKNLYEIYSEMKKNKINVSIFTFGVLLKLYVNLANKERSEEIYNEILRKNITPSIVIFQLMIKLYSYIGCIDNVWGIYKSMAEYKLAPDQQLFDSLIRINLKYNRLTEVHFLVKDAFSNKIIIEIYLIESFFSKINYSESLAKKQKKEICNEISDLYNKAKITLSSKCYSIMDEVFGKKSSKHQNKGNLNNENKFDIENENLSGYSKKRYGTLKCMYNTNKSAGKSIYDN